MTRTLSNQINVVLKITQFISIICFVFIICQGIMSVVSTNENTIQTAIEHATR